MDHFVATGRPVLVLSSDEAFRRAAVRAMRRCGMGVEGCRSEGDAHRRVAGDRAPLLVLAGSPARLASLCSGLRQRSPQAGIVAVSHYDGADQRIEVMRQGADLCLAGDLQVGELVAALQALARRVNGRGMPDAPLRPAPSVWRLLEKGWVLRTPEGASLVLTGAERAFMGELLGAPDARLDRRAYLAARAGETTRRLDMLVCRLRRKAARQGIDLPLRTVSGWGYAFAGAL